MHPLIPALYDIRNQFAFNLARDGIIDQLRTDPELPQVDRIRLPTILRDPERPWYEKVVLVGNRLLDPQNAQGGFFVQSYSQYVLESFLKGLLRRHGFGTDRPWSFIELELDNREIEYLRGFPTAVVLKKDALTPELGAIAFLSESLCLGDLYLSELHPNAEVWPIIRQMGWNSQARDFWFRDGNAEVEHKNLLAQGITRFGLRNSLEEPDVNRWMRTFTMQFGVSLGQWLRYASNRAVPAQPEGVAAQLLSNAEGPFHSSSFANTWQNMRRICQGVRSAADFERTMEQSPWIRNDWIPEILARLATTPADIAPDEPIPVPGENPFIGPVLEWTNGTANFAWQIDQEVLAILTPEECTELDLCGPNGRFGRLSRADHHHPWSRISGLRLSPALKLTVPLQEISESEISLLAVNDAACFRLHQSFNLWHSADQVTRFGSDGLRHASAWRRALPVGDAFSLRIESGARVSPLPNPGCQQEAAGGRWIHFAAGWHGGITVSDGEDAPLWDSSDLAAPARGLTADQRQFSTLLVIDQVLQGVISAHLEIHGADPVSVSVEGDPRGFADLRTSRALRFGTGHRDLSEIWSSLRVKIRIQDPNGRNHHLSRAAELTPRQLNRPVFLARTPEGNVFMLHEARIETTEQLRKLQIRALTPQGMGSAFLQQFARPLCQLQSVSKQVNDAAIARGLPIEYGLLTNPGEAITSGPLMPGVVERGIIRRIENFGADGGTFEIELTHPVEPDPSHRILILSVREGAPGQRLLKTTVAHENMIPAEADDWQTWRVQTGAPLDKILGVAIAYGGSLIGCWTKGGPTASQPLLSADDLTTGEVEDLADFIRWFHLPFFAGQGIASAVSQFIRKHAAAVLFRWASLHELNWGVLQLPRGIPDPQWETALRLLMMEANQSPGVQVSYAGLNQQIAGLAGTAWPILRKLMEIAPGCSAEIDWNAHERRGAITAADIRSLHDHVPNDHNQLKQFNYVFWATQVNERPTVARYYQEPDLVRREMTQNQVMVPDPDWSELRRDFAVVQKKKGSQDSMVDLWINPTYRINAALSHGLNQIRGQALEPVHVTQLQELMIFSSFARLLARKVLNPSFHIPHP
jgi:hypothetical protein